MDTVKEFGGIVVAFLAFFVLMACVTSVGAGVSLAYVVLVNMMFAAIFGLVFHVFFNVAVDLFFGNKTSN